MRTLNRGRGEEQTCDDIYIETQVNFPDCQFELYRIIGQTRINTPRGVRTTSCPRVPGCRWSWTRGLCSEGIFVNDLSLVYLDTTPRSSRRVVHFIIVRPVKCVMLVAQHACMCVSTPFPNLPCTRPRGRCRNRSGAGPWRVRVTGRRRGDRISDTHRVSTCRCSIRQRRADMLQGVGRE